MYSQFKRDVGREKNENKKFKKKDHYVIFLLVPFWNDVVKMFVILFWQFQQVLIRF